MVPTVPLITCKICFCIKMTEFTAMLVGSEDGSLDIKLELGSVDVKSEDESMEIKEEDDSVEFKEEDDSVEFKEEDDSVEFKEEDDSVEFKEECWQKKDPLSTTSQSTKSKGKIGDSS